MKLAATTLLWTALVLSTACAHQSMEKPTGGAAAAPPPIAANDNLMKLTCADYLATAKIATTVPADDAALAAQDELVNGLTWVHGYLYASNGGKFDALTQDWIKATATRIYERCSAAKDPKNTRLFEVATS